MHKFFPALSLRSLSTPTGAFVCISQAWIAHGRDNTPTRFILMRTRRAGKAGALPAAEPEEARPAVRGAIGGVRKKRGAAGGKAAAVLTKRVTLRGRTVSSREGRPAQPSASQEQPGPGSSNSAPAGQQQQQQQAGQQAAAAAGRQQVAAAARKRRGQLAAAKSSAPNIEGLTTEALQEIFLHLRKEDGEQQNYCRCGGLTIEAWESKCGLCTRRPLQCPALSLGVLRHGA